MVYDFFAQVLRSTCSGVCPDFSREPSRRQNPALRLLIGLGISAAVTACNSEPPRRPGSVNRNIAGVQPAASLTPEPAPAKTEPPAGEASTSPAPAPAPGTEQARPSGDQTATQPTKTDPGGTGTGGNNPPSANPTPAASPVSSTSPASPQPGGSPLTYRVYYKLAEPTVAKKRHGGWNLDCLSMRNAAGTQIAAPVCNKKLSTEGASKGCQVYHAENYGSSKSVSADLVNGAIEIRMTVTSPTSGAPYCPAGATDDVNGFRYVNPDGTQRVADTYSSANSAGRYKCGKQPSGSGFKYKVCFEDALEAAQSIPGAWDFNDYIVIIESSRDVGIAGINCNNTAIMQLPESTCVQ